MSGLPSASGDEAELQIVNQPAPSAAVRLDLARDRIRIGDNISEVVVRQLLQAGLELQSAHGLMDGHPAAGHVDSAISRIDEAIQDIRSILFDVQRGH